jgi:hypothetical protein
MNQTLLTPNELSFTLLNLDHNSTHDDFNAISSQISSYCHFSAKNEFQFHKGAIGVTNSLTRLTLTGEFQFHKGAIGVCVATFPSANFAVFQFHKGAIGVP